MIVRRLLSRRQSGSAQIPEGVAAATCELSRDLLVVVDSGGRIEWADARFARTVGEPEAKLVGRAAGDWLDGGGAGDPGAVRDAILRGAGGERIPIALRSALLPNDRRLFACEDLRTLRAQQTEASRQAERLDDAYKLAGSLRATLATLDLAADFAGVGTWRHDLRDQLFAFDERCMALLGLAHPSDGVADAVVRSLIHPDDVEAARAATRRALRGNDPVDAQARFCTADGRWLTLQLRFVAEREADGAVIGFAGAARLGAEDRGADAQAIARASRIEAIADTADIGIWSLAPSDSRVEWNAAMCRIFGLPDDAVRARPWAERLVHPDDAEPIRQATSRWAASREPALDLEYRIVRADGSVRWIALHARRGQQSMFGSVLDLTPLREAGAAAARADELVALTARAVGIGIWVRDLELGKAYWNEQLFRLYGIEPSERPPHHAKLMAAIHPDDRKHVAEMQASLRRRKPCRVELRARLRDGRERRIVSESRVVCDERGSPLRQIGVEWDVTEAHAVSQALRDRELAESGVRKKAQFLARVTRELRMLLKENRAFTQREISGSLGDESRTAKLEQIRLNGDRLLTVITDALDLWRIEAGQLVLQPQIVSLPKLAAEVFGRMQPLADRHGVRFEAAEVEGIVRADRMRLRQVLLNLAANAIKYNRQGGSASLVARPGVESVRISVSDDGRGMSQEQLARAFEPFEQIGTDKGTKDGAGVGLAIAKALVERMGAAIEVTSRPGQGSTFSFELPAAEETTRYDDPMTTTRALGFTTMPGLQSGQLLYIEDNPISVLIVEELVRTRTMFGIESAVDGSSGIARAIALQPDLILIDLQLPDMDGFEVLRRLRSHPATASIPCVALSGSAPEEDVQRAYALGFDDYWTKPIDLPSFVRGLNHVLRR